MDAGVEAMGLISREPAAGGGGGYSHARPSVPPISLPHGSSSSVAPPTGLPSTASTGDTTLSSFSHFDAPLFPSTPNPSSSSVTSTTPNGKGGGRGSVLTSSGSATASGKSGSPMPLLHRIELREKKQGCRIGLLWIFCLVAFICVAVACTLIWLISYLSTTSTVDTLTRDLRASVLHDCLYQVNREFGSTLRAAHSLRFLVRDKAPLFGDSLTVRNQTGWLSDITKTGALYPRLARIGIVNKYSFLATMTRPTSLTERAVLAASGQCALFLSEPTHFNQTTTTLQSFVLKPVREVIYDPPRSMDSDIHYSDPVELIEQFLGPVVANLTGYQTRGRPFWVAAEALAARGITGGWSEPFPVLQTPLQKPFLALLAFSAIVLPGPTGPYVDYLAFASISMSDFQSFFASLPIGDHGRAYLLRCNGRVLSSSDSGLVDLISSNVREVDMFTSQDEWIQKMTPFLLESGLVTTKPLTMMNSSLVVPYTDRIYDRSFSFHGDEYKLQASMTSNVSSGIPLVIVIITRDADFNGNLLAAQITTAWLSALVCIMSVFAMFLVTSLVTRPLKRVVAFMSRAVDVIAMARGEEQHAQLTRLCKDWSDDTHTANVIRTRTGGPLEDDAESGAVLESDKSQACQLFRCANVGRSLKEVDLMHRSFGSMLFSLASFDELEAINQAKRSFIKYIFHEVRVPFNAIVLGIEQTQLELKMHLRASHHCASLASCIDTMSIVHEQSEVVSRILNDVLSMQKIEDGALALDINSFDVTKMVRVCISAFSQPCAEKKLLILPRMQSLNALVEQQRQSIPILHEHPTIRLGALSAGRWRAYCEADMFRLRQALANLCSNAIKFSNPSGKIEIALEFDNFQPAVTAFANAFAPSADQVHAGAAGPRRNSKSLLGESEKPPSAATMQSPAEPVVSLPTNGNGIYRRSGDIHSAGGSPAEPRRTIRLAGCESDAAADAESANGDQFDANHDEYSGKLLGTVDVMMRVRDSGVGLSPENVSKMFKAYTQVNANKAQAGGGTGLGLNISKSIVELHGGTIGVTSEEGVGSEFWIHLPNRRVILMRTDDTSSARDQAEEDDQEASEHSEHSGTSVRPSASARSVRSARKSMDAKRLAALAAAQLGPTPLTMGDIDLLPTHHRSHPPATRSHVFSSDHHDSSHLPTVRFHDHPSDDDEPSPDDEHSRDEQPDQPNRHSRRGAIKIRRTSGKENSLMPSSATDQRLDTSQLLDRRASSARSSAAAPATGQRSDHAQSVLVADAVVGGSAFGSPVLSPNQAHQSHHRDHVMMALSRTMPTTTRTLGLGKAEGAKAMAAAAAGVLQHQSFGSVDLSARPRMSADLTAGESLQATSAGSMPASAFTSPSLMAASGSPPLVGLTLPVELRLAPSMSSPASAAGPAPAAHGTPTQGSCTIKSGGGPSARVAKEKATIRAGAKVLVVEDSLPNRKLLISILTSMKLVATGVEDGLQCVNLYPLVVEPDQELLFDVIIMDGNMPVMNGIDASRILRSRGVTAPILALTGNALEEDIAAFIEAGATSVLTKPVNRSQLSAALTLHLPAKPKSRAA